MKFRICPFLVPGLALGAVFTGCSSTNLEKVVMAAGNDQAIVIGKVTSVYGTASFTRIGGTTNTITVAPDGTVTVNK